MIKLAFGVPAYGSQVDIGHVGTWFAIGAALAQSQDKFSLGMLATYHINGIDHCRNTMVHDALAAKCDWLLMIDADTFHFAGTDAIGDNGIDVLQMIIDGERRGAAVIGAPVRARKVESSDYVVYVQSGFVATHQETPGVIRLADESYFRGKVVPVARLGGAFTAVNLNWLRKNWPETPWFKFTYSTSGKPTMLSSEDYHFCDGVRERDGVVLCDGRFDPSHVGRRQIVGK